MNIIIVNHGNVFKTGNWYTFYCPECGVQIERDTESKPCECGCTLVWEKMTRFEKKKHKLLQKYNPAMNVRIK